MSERVPPPQTIAMAAFVVEDVRAEVCAREDMTPPFGQCLIISDCAAADLTEMGVEVRVVHGVFELDQPAPDLFVYGDLDDDD
jgi:hypothetical protein